MILSDKDIRNLIDEKLLLIEPFDQNNLRESSIKLHLGKKILKYDENILIDLKDESSIKYSEIEIPESGYVMKPNDFLVGVTKEKVTIPNGFMGWIETRGSVASIGLQMHFCDAHIDPGSSLNITLQLKNNSNHSIKIYPDFYVVKLYIFKMTSDSDNTYNGVFQNSTGPTTFKN